MYTTCTCPPTNNLTFEELIDTFNLLGTTKESKNCCERAGYICPNLDRALRKAYHKRYLVKKGNSTDGELSTHKNRKVLRKRVLSLSPPNRRKKSKRSIKNGR